MTDQRFSLRVTMEIFPHHQYIFHIEPGVRFCIFQKRCDQHGIPVDDAFFRRIHPRNILMAGNHYVNFPGPEQ